MKKIFFAFVISLLLAPCFGTEAAYVGTVNYGGFEDAKATGVVPTGWTVYSNVPWYGNFTTSTDYAAEGIYSLKTVAPQGSGLAQALVSGAEYWGYFDTNAQYELSIKILVPEGSSVTDALLRVRLYNVDGTTISDVYSPPQQRITGNTGGEWKTIRTVFTPKRNFGALEKIYIRCNTGVSGTAYWDDLQLHKLNSDGTYADTMEESTKPQGTDVMKNGDFSELASGTLVELPTTWAASGTWGEAAVIERNAEGTATGVTLKGSGNPYIRQTISVRDGKTYTITGRVRAKDATPVIKLTFSGANEVSKTFGRTDGGWADLTHTFTVPANVSALTIYFRKYELADVSYHSLSLVENGTTANLLVNGDFTSVSASGARPKNWISSGAWGQESVLIPRADGENTAVKLCGAGTPYVTQTFTVAGGETYTIRGRLRSDGGTPVIKFSYGGAGGEFTTESFGDTSGRWRDFTYDFVVPAGAESLSLLFRKYGAPDVYYANLKLYKTGDVPLLTVNTENETTFYYTSWLTGQAAVHLNCTPESGEKVRFSLWDGEKETGIQTVAANTETKITFSLSGLVKGKKYLLRAALIAAGGAVRGTAEKEIYVFDPPGAINEKGQMKNADGTFSDVLFGYHVYEDDMETAAALGVNVIQGLGNYEFGSMGTFLDAAQKNGLRVLVPLYIGNMLPAGHYVNRERTEEIIKTYKDHPAVFGWMIQDEPFLHNRNRPEEVKRQLLDSYLLVRLLDPYHPTYMTADRYSREHYRDIGNACDIIAPDHYPIGSGQDVVDVYANMAAVNEAVQGKKPVFALLQTFAYAGSRQPTIDELMHMIYQSFFAGADAVGYYSFRESNWNFASTELYDDVANALPELWETYRIFRRTDAVFNGTENGILKRVFPDGEMISANMEKTEKTVTVDNISLTYGDGSLKKDGEKKVISLGVYGRAQGKKGMIPFTNLKFLDGEGKPIQKLKAGEITVKIDLGGKAILPDGTTLWIVRVQESGGARELLDFKMCKAETDGSYEVKINTSGRAGERIEVILFAPSGQPVYKKAVMQ